MSQEEINNEVQIRLAVHDEKFSSLITRIDATNNKVDNLISEMRDRDNRRAAEIAEIRTSTDAKISEIKNSVDGIAKHVQNFSIAAFVGIGAMVVTSVIGLFRKVKTQSRQKIYRQRQGGFFYFADTSQTPIFAP